MWLAVDGPAWIIDPPFDIEDEYLKDSVLDCALKPIRDPGPDAVDEMVQKLGSPTQKRVKEKA
jgi:hypothetical protein